MQTQQEMAKTRRARLQAWMGKHQVSRTELARRLEVGRAYTSLLLIERGEGDAQKTRFFGEKAARSIEAKLGLPPGYLDSDGSVQPPAISDWRTLDQVPESAYALVPRVSMEVVDGVVTDQEYDLPPLAFRREWLKSHGVRQKAGLRVLEVKGDAMAEYLQPGDVVLIDMEQTQIEDRAVYALRFSDEIRLRRLEKTFDGGVRIIPDNAIYKTEELSPEQAKALVCLGRCVWRSG